jgi:hypothetical protein
VAFFTREQPASLTRQQARKPLSQGKLSGQEFREVSFPHEIAFFSAMMDMQADVQLGLFNERG